MKNKYIEAEKHQRDFLDAFKEIHKDLKRSKNLDFDRHIAVQAWNMQVAADLQFIDGKRKTRMSLNPIYYVYVLLDPRLPGTFSYTFPGGRVYSFGFKPFYVGKGRDQRSTHHVRDAKRSPAMVKGQHKLNVIRSIHNAGLEPIEKIITGHSIESIALAKEEIIIDILGRACDRTGCLTNITLGGEGGAGGIVGRCVSEEVREKIRQSLIGRTTSEEARKHMRKNSPRRGKPISPEHRAAIVAANQRRKGTKKRTPVSEETRRKLSEANRGRPKPESVRLAVIESNKRRAGEARAAKSSESYRKGWETRQNSDM
jgi:hypothetical protein